MTKRNKRLYKFSGSSLASGRSSTSNKLPTQNFIVPSVGGSIAHQNNNSNFVNFINAETNFQNMARDDIIEHLYIMEPEIATAIDSFGLMVRDAFKYYTVDDFEDIDESLAKKMIKDANKLAKKHGIKNLYETYASIIRMHGNLFLGKINGSLVILPNDRVSVLDTKERIMNPGLQSDPSYKSLITQANYLIMDEQLDTQMIFNPGEWFMIKFRDVPIYVEDCKKRMTYGIYSISPLRRSIIPVWYKRVVMANDALWRAKNVPREHHMLSADSFNTQRFTKGTIEDKAAQAESLAYNAIENAKESLEYQTPDMAYVTLDNYKIENIEPKSVSYMQANECISQINESIFAAINLPKSIIQGASESNYASDLVIYAHASSQVIQIAEKISDILDDVIKERLLLINKNYPVDNLIASIDYDMANNQETMWNNAIKMGALGKFTDDEVRDMVNYKPLTKDQLQNGRFVNTSNNNSIDNTTNDSNSYPTTPHSAETQPTDAAKAQTNKPNKRVNRTINKGNIKQ